MNKDNPISDEQQQDRRARPAMPVWLAEHALVLLASVIFVGFLYALTQYYFPGGTGISPTGNALPADSPGADRNRSSLQFSRAAARSSGQAAGRIIRTRHSVEFRAGDEISWQVARTGRELFARDAVQTKSASSAVIAITDTSSIEIGENSLVVLQERQPDLLRPDRQSMTVMVEGELTGIISTEDEGHLNLGIKLPNAVVRLASVNAGDVEFRVAVNDDQSASLDLISGSAVVATAEREVSLGPRQGLVMSADGLRMEASDLPAAPHPDTPGVGAVKHFLQVAPQVDLTWQSVPGADRYRVQIARDQGFDQLLADELTAATRFRFVAKGPGRYYWRLSARHGRLQGARSAASWFEVLEDRKPPGLSVEPPARVVYEDHLELRGNTEPGARLFVDGEPVATAADGGFEYVIRLEAGANLLIVESMDDVGNVAYANFTVIAKTSERQRLRRQ